MNFDSAGAKQTALGMTNPKITVTWVLAGFLANITVGVDLQRMLAVLWVKGFHAYFEQGIRVLPIKPAKFSDGTMVPDAPNAIFTFVVFLALMLVTWVIIVLVVKHISLRTKAAE